MAHLKRVNLWSIHPFIISADGFLNVLFFFFKLDPRKPADSRRTSLFINRISICWRRPFFLFFFVSARLASFDVAVRRWVFFRRHSSIGFLFRGDVAMCREEPLWLCRMTHLTGRPPSRADGSSGGRRPAFTHHSVLLPSSRIKSYERISFLKKKSSPTLTGKKSWWVIVSLGWIHFFYSMDSTRRLERTHLEERTCRKFFCFSVNEILFCIFCSSSLCTSLYVFTWSHLSWFHLAQFSIVVRLSWTEFHWVLLGFVGIYGIVPSFTGLNWAVANPDGKKSWWIIVSLG